MGSEKDLSVNGAKFKLHQGKLSTGLFTRFDFFFLVQSVSIEKEWMLTVCVCMCVKCRDMFFIKCLYICVCV